MKKILFVMAGIVLAGMYGWAQGSDALKAAAEAAKEISEELNLPMLYAITYNIYMINTHLMNTSNTSIKKELKVRQSFCLKQISL